jgi:hypothetical protein
MAHDELPNGSRSLLRSARLGPDLTDPAKELRAGEDEEETNERIAKLASGERE